MSSPHACYSIAVATALSAQVAIVVLKVPDSMCRVCVRHRHTLEIVQSNLAKLLSTVDSIADATAVHQASLAMSHALR